MNKIYFKTFFILLIIIYSYLFIKFCFSDLFLEYYTPELLINYSSGFIRRGLLGEFFFQFYKIGINPLIIIRLFNIISYILIIIFFIKNFLYYKLDLYFLLFPFTLPYLLLCNMIGFRDYFLLLLIIPILRLFIRNNNNYVLINILCIIGILSHEMFIFMFFPFIILLIINNFKKYKYKILIFIPSIIIFIITFINHGTLKQSNKIYQSIKYLIPKNDEVTNEIPAPILALSGELENHISYVFFLNNTGFSRGLIYMLFIIFLIFLFFNFKSFIKEKNSKFNYKFLFIAFTFNIVCSLPLYYAAIDWQRFINMSILSSLIFTFIYSKENIKNSKTIDNIYESCNNYLLFDNKKAIYILSLLFIVPYIQLGSQKYLFSNAIIIIIHYFSKIVLSL